jgi:AcrR family transcriptional regulator
MIDGTARRGPYAGTQRRRETIVAAAFDAFAQGGFRGSSLQEISDAVGLSKAGLLHHFASKEELLLEVLEMREQMNRPPAHIRGLGILTHLRNRAVVDSATRGATALFVVMSAEATNPSHPAHAFFVRRYDRSIRTIAAALDQARIDGELKEDLDAVEAARLIVAVMDGLQVQMLLDPAFDRTAALNTYLDDFLATNSTPSAVTTFLKA